jgi:hypothetical protein
MHARSLFGIAAAFNFAVAASVLFLRPWIGPLFQLDPATGTNLVNINIAGVLIACFGWAYVCVARDPVRYRPNISFGIIGKLGVAIATFTPWLTGAIGWRVPALAAVDLVFAALFADFLRRTR